MKCKGIVFILKCPLICLNESLEGPLSKGNLLLVEKSSHYIFLPKCKMILMLIQILNLIWHSPIFSSFNLNLLAHYFKAEFEIVVFFKKKYANPGLFFL